MKSKAMNRLGIVLRHAAAMGLAVDLQATEKAKALLGKSRHQMEHVPAMPWEEVPAFYASLEEPTITHLALRLFILTGARSRPIRFLRPEQIEENVWTIPGEAMKGIKGRTADFRIPLSHEARRILRLALPFQRDGYLFPSLRKGVISDATMSRLMERRGMKERPHGFRSSLRVWLVEATEAPQEVAETVLAHVVGSSVSRAYQRSDHLDQRRDLLERWAQHVTGMSPSHEVDKESEGQSSASLDRTESRRGFPSGPKADSRLRLAERFAPSTLHRFFARRGITYKKRPATRPSRIVRTSPGRGRPGSTASPRSTPSGSSSSTRPG